MARYRGVIFCSTVSCRRRRAWYHHVFIVSVGYMRRVSVGRAYHRIVDIFVARRGVPSVIVKRIIIRRCMLETGARAAKSLAAFLVGAEAAP